MEWSQLWPYAVLVALFAAWALYHFLAPVGWRDWTGAGLVQAFAIALYGEMYGFPLSIYLATIWLPIDIPVTYDSGHLWAALLGYGRLGSVIQAGIGYIFIVIGLLLIVKGWVKFYFGRGRLIDDGVYGVIRHPQYTGIFLVIFGQIIDWPTVAALALMPVIVGIYVHLARREEADLMHEFGAAYETYRRKVPMFFPRWRDAISRMRFP